MKSTIRRGIATNLFNAVSFGKALGLNNYSKWHWKHTITEQSHTGPFKVFMDTTAPQILGVKYKKYEKILGMIGARDSDGKFVFLSDKTANKKKSL